MAVAFVLTAGLAIALEAVVASAQPVDNLAPEVVGVSRVGERIVCAAGSWSGSVAEFRYRWLRDGVPIASSVAYVISAADRGHTLWCVVTASGSEGSAEAESINSLSIAGGSETPPVSTSAPEISGTPAPGSALSCSSGEWNGNPPPTFTYQWLREGTPLESASASTYTVVSADQGYSLACKVTATNSAGHASALSRNSLHVPGSTPANTTPPQVLGVAPAAIGETLTCSPGSWTGSPPPAFAYRWVRDRGLAGETPIASATAPSYTVQTADQLHTLACVVIATNSEGHAEAASANSITVHGSPPQNTAAPLVTGVPAVGQTLGCSRGTWTGTPAPAYTYLWVRDQGMAAEQAVGSASTYVVSSEDVGHALSCEVTARNGEGEATASSEPVVVPQGGGVAPHNLEAPLVYGTPAPGETVHCTQGSWSASPEPTFLYRWRRDGATIASATADAYLVAEADRGHALSCLVTAVNSEGAASAPSTNSLQVPGIAPQNIEPPRIAGTPAVGQLLSCVPGVWGGAPAPEFSYRWLRDGTGISAANAQSYTVTPEDRGAALACAVTAHNSAGSGEAASSSLAIPGGAPVNTAPPSVSGTPLPGQVLTCVPGAWSGAPAPTFAYQWRVNGIDLPSATGTTYTVASANRGFVLTCVVTASNREGSESASSAGVRVPGVKPAVLAPPQVAGTPAVGQPLTCVRGTWEGSPPPEFRYEWLRDGAGIAAATEAAYTAQIADQGHVLSCRVTATNDEGTAEAHSANGLTITTLPSRSASLPELTFAPLPNPPLSLSAQLRAALRLQLARAQSRIRLASLRRTGVYTFPFSAPAAGTLQIFWYPSTSGTQTRSSTTTPARPPLLAQSSTPFSRAGVKAVTLRLTEAGRREVIVNRSVTLSVRAVFRPRGHPVSMLSTFLLNR